MRRSLRYLRITFSLTCGIAAVLLAMLWVRGYRGADQVLQPRDDGYFSFISTYGDISGERKYWPSSSSGDGHWAFWRIKGEDWHWHFKPRTSSPAIQVEAD